MRRFVSQWIDRKVIQFAAERMPQPDGRDLHLERARELVENLDFSFAVLRPAGVKFNGPIEFHFISPLPSQNSTNDTVHGRLFRCGEDWQTKPIVLLLHGWNDALDHHYFFARYARRMNRLGLSVATLQLPWQFDRQARELGIWGTFLNADLLHTTNGILQGMADIRAFVDWLRAQGCPFVGLWGVSLGGLMAGLTICHDSRINAAVLTVPVARIDRMINEVPFCETIRQALAGKQIDLRKLNLVLNQPVIPLENILLVEAEYDLFVAKECVEELWQAWGRPEIARFHCGHITILALPGYSRRAIQWLAAKALAPAAK